jgi:hypothetical protein
MHVRLAAALVAILSLSLNLGCGNNAPPKETAQSEEAHHDHEEGQDHGHKEGEAHAHPSEGPHHGDLIELGKEEYHAELTHDEATNTVTIYLLDGSAANNVAIDEKEITLNMVADGKPSQFKLPAAPQADDPAGQSSKFSLSDEALMEALETPNATGRVNITIQGKSYTGTVEHHDHEEHDHK